MRKIKFCISTARNAIFYGTNLLIVHPIKPTPVAIMHNGMQRYVEENETVLKDGPEFTDTILLLLIRKMILMGSGFRCYNNVLPVANRDGHNPLFNTV